jgi:hypothetical protein
MSIGSRMSSADQALEAEIADRRQDHARRGSRTGQYRPGGDVFRRRTIEKFMGDDLREPVKDRLPGDQHVVGAGRRGERRSGLSVLITAHTGGRAYG